jgi:hypothetical protein
LTKLRKWKTRIVNSKHVTSALELAKMMLEDRVLFVLERVKFLNNCFLIRERLPAIVFVHVLNSTEYVGLTKNFLDSFRKFGPGEPCELVVVFNNGKPSDTDKALYEGIPSVKFLEHDNSGFDIGAFIAASHQIDNPMAVYFGGTAFLQRAGWLVELHKAWDAHGPGFYGTLSTYEVSPHLNTTGFACAPELMRRYPHKVNTKEERYAFEHRGRAMWRMVAGMGLPTKLVTWDGVWDWQDWRTPPNIYRRGDQSNCCTYFRHSTNFAFADDRTKRYMSALADTLIDPEFKYFKGA